MKRLLYLHPFILAAISAVILFISMQNVGIYIAPADVAIPSLWAIAICAVVYGIAVLLTRQLKSAALIASLLILGLVHLWYIFLAVSLLTLFCLLIFKIILKKARLEEANIALSLISILIFGFYLTRLLIFIFSNPPLRPLSNAVEPVMTGQSVTVPSDRYPDIYYIILDGYGREDMLQSVHGFDNSAFISALQQRGFTVAPESQSNYPRTLLSLASSLNLQYLDSISAKMVDNNLWWPVKGAIQHSQVRSFLETLGYKTVFVASGWDYTDISDGDVYLKAYPIMLHNFQMGYIRWTNLRFFNISSLGVSFPSVQGYRQVILREFEALSSAPSITGPKFVFAHIMAPHPPYIFGRDGGLAVNNIVLPDPGTPGYAENIRRYRQGYLDQLIYTNQRVLEMLDSILSNSSAPPVILLQGDHGPDVFMDFKDASNACLMERYSILNAYYLPGVAADAIPADISPVNSFRLIFDHYFGTSLPMLPNQRYFSQYLHLYRFQDITSQTEVNCRLPPDVGP